MQLRKAAFAPAQPTTSDDVVDLPIHPLFGPISVGAGRTR
jgi:hypothetical protein